MAISYTDSYGSVVDTGVGVQPTARANTEIETHTALEIDTGSKNSIAVSQSNHKPHRDPNSPR